MSVWGVCTLHGPGAAKHWKPRMLVTIGKDGKSVKTMTKEYYYVCDLAPPMDGGKGGGRLRQTSLSNFVKTTPKPRLEDNDIIIEGNGLGTAGLEFSLSMCTVGQKQDCDEKHGNFVVDENERQEL